MLITKGYGTKANWRLQNNWTFAEFAAREIAAKNAVNS
jgi:hypothetical protein